MNEAWPPVSVAGGCRRCAAGTGMAAALAAGRYSATAGATGTARQFAAVADGFATPVSSLILLGLVVFFRLDAIQSALAQLAAGRRRILAATALQLAALCNPRTVGTMAAGAAAFFWCILLFNGLWWWILARRVEQLDGWLALLALLLLCGWLGNAIQWWYAGPAFGGLSGVTMGTAGLGGYPSASGALCLTQRCCCL